VQKFSRMFPLSTEGYICEWPLFSRIITVFVWSFSLASLSLQLVAQNNHGLVLAPGPPVGPSRHDSPVAVSESERHYNVPSGTYLDDESGLFPALVLGNIETDEILRELELAKAIVDPPIRLDQPMRLDSSGNREWEKEPESFLLVAHR
jgi:hypothetical protein